MTGQSRFASFRLSSTQALVVETIVGPPERSSVAWRAVRPTLDLDVMEEGSYFLLPLLYRRLLELQIEDPDLPRLKGVYRRTWYRNHLLLEELQSALAELAGDSVTVLAYAALALATTCHEDLGARWIPYAEMIAQPGDLERAEAALRRAGFRPANGHRRHALQPTPYVNDAQQVLVIAGAPPLDLLAPADLAASARDVWRRASEHEIAGQTVLTLDPTDEFLLVCLNGAKPAGKSDPVWVVDAATLIPHVDWDRLCASAESSHTALLLQDALHYLAEVYAAAIPAATLERLGSVRRRRREVLARRLVAHAGGVAGDFPGTLADYLRVSNDAGLLRTVAGVPEFLRRRWQLDHAWQVPARALTKSVATARRAV